MIETHERIIDDASYSVTQLPARRALKLKAKLLKLFGPFFFGNGSETLASLFKSLDENQLDSLCMEMLQGVRKNGVELSPATFDLEFAGDMAGIYKLLIFIVEVNYANFFSLLGIGIPDFQDSPKQVPDTRKTFHKT